MLLHGHPLIASNAHCWVFKLYISIQAEASWYAGFTHTAVITAGAVPDSMYWAESPAAIAIGQPTILDHGMLKMEYKGGRI